MLEVSPTTITYHAPLTTNGNYSVSWQLEPTERRTLKMMCQEARGVAVVEDSL